MINVNNNKNKYENYAKVSNNQTADYKYITSSIKDVESYAPSLEAQGRAFVNMKKISFKGNDTDSLIKEYLENTDLPESVIKDLVQLPLEQRKEALELYEEGIIPNSPLLISLVQADSQTKQKILDLIRKGIDSEKIIKDYCVPEKSTWDVITGADKDMDANTKYDKIKDYIDKGLDVDTINFLLLFNAEINEESIKRTEYFYSRFKSDPGLMVMIPFDDIGYINYVINNKEQFQRAVLLSDAGIKNIRTIALFSETQEKCEKGISLCNSGYSEEDLYDIAGCYDLSVMEKVQELMKKYNIKGYEAESIISNPSKDRIETALQRLLEIDATSPSLNLAELPDEVFEIALELIKDGYTKKEVEDLIGYGGNYEDLFLTVLKNRQLNFKWNKFLQNTKYSNRYKKELSNKDVKFLKTHAFNNQFYDPDKYTRMFLFLKNIKTFNGENILGCESLTNKIKTNGMGDFAYKQKDMMYKNIEALLNIDPKSKKADYIRTILRLMHIGKVNPSALRELSDLNDLLDKNAYLNSKSNSWEISNNLANDIELIKSNGMNSENYTDKYIPTYKNEQQGIENSNIGDAFKIEGEKYIRIKTREDNSETVKLSKETYAKLFPPVERFLTTQQIMGNCYCIETLMSLYSDNKTRVQLLKTMEEDDNGNITIKLPDYKPVKFEKGKLPESENIEIYSSGAYGYKLFEYAYSCALVEDQIKNAREHLTGDRLTEFNDFINSNPDNFFIYEDKKEIKWTTHKEAVEKGLYKKYYPGRNSYKTFNNVLLGNGGMQNDVYKKLGYKSICYTSETGSMSKKEIINTYKRIGVHFDEINTKDKLYRILEKNPDYFTNHQVQLGIKNHAYCLTQETDNNGNKAYYLYNPHNQGFPIKFDCLNDILGVASDIAVIEINND